jgi:predicted AlkP superfamily phosphohydrolase/phosphomutase
LRNLFPGLKNRANSILRGLKIDWENTQAFSWENAPSIFINLRNKFPQGNVDEGEEYEQVRQDIIEKLMNLRVPENGAPIVDRVVKKEDVYSGPYIEKAPDLFIEWKNDAYTVRPGFAGESGDFIEEVTGDRLKKVERISRASGVHKPDGVFMFTGDDIQEGIQVSDLGLHDVTSTILYYLGVPIPEDLDGRVVADVFEKAFLEKNAVSYSDMSTESDAFDVNYSDEESKIIAERLQGLGYID